MNLLSINFSKDLFVFQVSAMIVKVIVKNATSHILMVEHTISSSF